MTIKDRYRITRTIGIGPLAEVFCATAMGGRGFEREVAIKKLGTRGMHDAEFTRRFVAAAQIAGSLVHSNIVSVLDFDADEADGLALVMELVDGVDLHRLIESGPIAPEVTIFIITEVLRGLGYAHRAKLPGGTKGVVHQDVCPRNILVSWEGAVKVSDFGVAGVITIQAESSTQVLSGAQAYMSPEQATGHFLDGRSDLFSVGVVLWELLADRPLFVSSTLDALLLRPIPPPSQLRNGIPPDLERFALRLLSRDPATRFQTAEDALSELLACQRGRGGRDELIALLVDRFPRTAPTREDRLVSAGKVTPKRRAGRAVLALALVGAIGGVSTAIALSVRDTTESSSTHADEFPGEIPPDLVLPPHCRRMIVVEKRLSFCRSQIRELRAGWADSYDVTVETFRASPSKADDAVCSSGLPQLESRLAACPVVTAEDEREGTLHPESRVPWMDSTKAKHLAKADADVLRVHNPNCSHLLELLDARAACEKELPTLRKTFHNVINAYADVFADIQYNVARQALMKPGDVMDASCIQAEVMYRGTGNRECNPP